MEKKNLDKNFKKQEQEQEPLLLRFREYNGEIIRFSVSLRNITSPNCPPCGILILSGDPNREGSPIAQVKRKVEAVDKGNKIVFSMDNENYNELKWKSLLVENPDEEIKKKQELWTRLFWLRQDDNETIDAAFNRLRKMIFDIDRIIIPKKDGSILAFPLIGTKATPDIEQRFHRMADVLLCLKLKNIKKLILYTHNTDTLHKLNLLLTKIAFSPCYFLLWESKDNANLNRLVKLDNIEVKNHVVNRCVNIICSSIYSCQEFAMKNYEKGESYYSRAHSAIAGSIQTIATNTRIIIENIVIVLTNTYSKNHPLLKQKISAATIVSAKLKILQNFFYQLNKYNQKNEPPYAYPPGFSPPPQQIFKHIKAIRTKCNLLQHANSMWFIGELDLCDFIDDLFILIDFCNNIFSPHSNNQE